MATLSQTAALVASLNGVPEQWPKTPWLTATPDAVVRAVDDRANLARGILATEIWDRAWFEWPEIQVVDAWNWSYKVAGVELNWTQGNPVLELPSLPSKIEKFLDNVDPVNHNNFKKRLSVFDEETQRSIIDYAVNPLFLDWEIDLDSISTTQSPKEKERANLAIAMRKAYKLGTEPESPESSWIEYKESTLGIDYKSYPHPLWAMLSQGEAEWLEKASAKYGDKTARYWKVSIVKRIIENRAAVKTFDALKAFTPSMLKMFGNLDPTTNPIFIPLSAEGQKFALEWFTVSSLVK